VQRALRASEEKYRLLTENSVSVIALYEIERDGQGQPANFRCIDVNPAFERHAGIPRERVRQQLITDALPWAKETGLLDFMLRTAGGCKPESIEFYIRSIDRYYHIGAYCLEGGRFATESLDITERKRAEKELRDMNRRLEDSIETANRLAAEAAAANATKSQFLANMSHEIRTPLNAIIGFAQMLKGDGNLTPPQAAQMRTIERSGQHLLDIINDVLDMSKIEAGRIELDETDVSLVDLLNDLERIFRDRAQAKGLALRIEREAGLPGRIRGDGRKLRQVLTNLLGNAVKFTQVGEVALRACMEEAPGRKSMLRVELRDTGPGISPEDQDKIFMPFEQTESGRRAGGAGLGLAISRSLVERMGGRLEVESRAGCGSRFLLAVPVAATVRDGSTAGGEPSSAPQAQAMDEAAWAQRLAALPAEAVEAMVAAAEAGEMDKLERWISRAEQVDAEVGRRLRALAERYDYGNIKLALGAKKG
jgi:signal transduction histidine kinase